LTTPKKVRCAWAESDKLLLRYHDEEWGFPTHDDRLLFEMLNLEGAQAGLSWLTILRKRDHYRLVFDQFDPDKIAKYDTGKKEALLKDAGIVRNRRKIEAVVENAKACLKVKHDYGSFDKFIWAFVDGKSLVGSKKHEATEASERMSKSLKKNGFHFVGPTICYAFMQAVGMVNDHAAECFRANKSSQETAS